MAVLPSKRGHQENEKPDQARQVLDRGKIWGCPHEIQYNHGKIDSKPVSAALRCPLAYLPRGGFENLHVENLEREGQK